MDSDNKTTRDNLKRVPRAEGHSAAPLRFKFERYFRFVSRLAIMPVVTASGPS